MHVPKRLAKAWEAVARGAPGLLTDDDFAPRAPRAPPVKQEAPRQRAVVSYLRKHLPEGSVVCAVTNHSRSREQTFFLVAQGMLPGMPDLLIFTPGPAVHAIEMKGPDGRLSDAQRHVQGLLTALGVPVLAECTGIDEARDWLREQGVKI